MRRVSSSLLVAGLLVVVGCAAHAPPRNSEETCRASCASNASSCSREACERGCNFALDRVVERQIDPVIACVAKAGACDDRAWARCSVRIGVHADGGPPAPPPPLEDD